MNELATFTNRQSRSNWVLISALVTSSIALTTAVRGDGPLYGEVSTTLWISSNTPAFVDLFADIIDRAFTDLAAPAVFFAIASVVWWRWGRYAAMILGIAGICTGLTRVGDLVQRPRPTSTVEWSDYSFGSGGYPSGHVVFTVLVLGTVAMLARRHTTPKTARWVVGVMQLLIMVTSWSRISRLEHWPLDVVGGVLMASTGLCGIIWLHSHFAALAVKRSLLRRLLQL